ncbi:uncharacterized protein [Physcomitrium patens]|uniref:SUI1 domain-containing protein n=1 Tax=Physcomitrium patens TaxID=3218 RepID=A0A2K1KC24_PHYPA|nr:uncharacterized protein LOC112285134 isoform X1 [Physcomitrium patens]PNR51330.1 hypothetical protein PHYPA_010516 [Physcomitrium patens]|eukprot:XP_024381465.1 uncharacterized protein LOC112285134 isoform X1 [Physcomitrella patens]
MQLLVRFSIPRSEFIGARVQSSTAFSFCQPGPRVLRVFAGENKRQPNFIDIGAGSRRGWDEVKVNRSTQGSEVKKGKSSLGKKAEPARTPVTQVDVRPEQQNLIVEATKRGRGGKTVTLIKGLQLQEESLEALCKTLKTKMGSGGAVKEGEIEIQGNHSAKLVEELLKMGYKAKKSGR